MNYRKVIGLYVPSYILEVLACLFLYPYFRSEIALLAWLVLLIGIIIKQVDPKTMHSREISGFGNAFLVFAGTALLLMAPFHIVPMLFHYLGW